MVFKKGNIPWNKGIKQWDTRKNPMLGRHHTEKAKRKMSKSRKNKYAGENHPLYGTHHSIDAREKISCSLKEFFSEHPEAIKNLSDKHKNKRHSKKTRELMGKISKQHWKNPDYVEKLFKAWNKRPNKVEKKLDDILQKYFPNEWKYNGDFSCGVTIGGLIPDFINCNGKKQVIDVFGDYWHGERAKKPRETEEGRKEILREYGYDCLIIWEYELRNLSEEKIIEKIESGGKM